MPSPDITPYVDLTIYDQQPQDVYDAALDYARVSIPDWEPAAGSIEDAMLQAAAGVTGELLAALNRVPSSVLEALLQLFGITRITGVAPTALVRITFIDDLGHTVPYATRFGYLDTTDSDPILYVFETIEDVIVPQGFTSVDVNIEGILLEQYPSLLTGQDLRLLSGLSFIESIELSDNLDVGNSGETDEEYFSRAIALLNSYTSAIVLPDQYDSYILGKYSNIYRSNTYNLLNPTNENIVGFVESPGYVTVYACGTNGAAITSESALAIAEDVSSRAVGGLIVTVKSPNLVNVSIAVTVLLTAGSLSSTVETAVKAAIAGYVSPDSWPWENTIYYNELIALIDGVTGVDRVVTLTISAPSGGATLSGTDLAFTKFGSLPISTVTFTGQAAP